MLKINFYSSSSNIEIVWFQQVNSLKDHLLIVHIFSIASLWYLLGVWKVWPISITSDISRPNQLSMQLLPHLHTPTWLRFLWNCIPIENQDVLQSSLQGSSQYEALKTCYEFCQAEATLPEELAWERRCPEMRGAGPRECCSWVGAVRADKKGLGAGEKPGLMDTAGVSASRHTNPTFRFSAFLLNSFGLHWCDFRLKQN